MKVVRVTLTRGGHRAVCTMSYRDTDGPLEVSWTGRGKALIFGSRTTPSLQCPLERLEEVVVHQARLCGAEYEIVDLGGQAMEWRDEVHGFGPLFPDGEE